MEAVLRGRIDARPLVDAIDARGGLAACGIVAGRTPTDSALARAVQRAAKESTMTLAAADKCATQVLGLHPTDLWGTDDWVAAVLAAADGDEPR